MLRRLLAFTLVVSLWASHAHAAPRNDVNILTALDFSESVSVLTLRSQVEAIAATLRSSEFINAVRSGPNGQIGFSVFCWSSQSFPSVVHWRTIASKNDAHKLARELDAWAAQDILQLSREGKRFPGGRGTNLARAMFEARELLGAAPDPAQHLVVNIIGNGRDNLNGDVPRAREQLLSMGATVNGVIPVDAMGLDRYYSANVVGGPSSFLLKTAPAEDLTGVMILKFRMDMIAENSPTVHRRSH